MSRYRRTVVSRHPERACEFGRVPDLAVPMGQHGPEASQGGSRHANSKRRQVTFQECPRETFEPEKGARVRSGKPRFRKAAAQPTTIEAVMADLIEAETTEPVVVDPARERLRRLPEQIGRCAAEHQESRPPRAAIRQHAKNRKQFRPALHLVADDQTAEFVQNEFRVIHQAVEIGGTLQVQPDASDPDTPDPPDAPDVVLPICRGPSMATTGNVRSRCRRASTCCFLRITPAFYHEISAVAAEFSWGSVSV